MHYAGTPDWSVQTVVANWHGELWYAVALPDNGHGPVSLSAISCATTSNCVAVGNDESGLVGASWRDITGWSLSSIPDAPTKDAQAEQEPNGFQLLTGVSCWEADACQAVGITNTAPFHRVWDGTTWTTVANPPPTGALATTEEASYDVNGIDCYSATFCLTAGDVTYGTLVTETYFEQYRG